MANAVGPQKGRSEGPIRSASDHRTFESWTGHKPTDRDPAVQPICPTETRGTQVEHQTLRHRCVVCNGRDNAVHLDIDGYSFYRGIEHAGSNMRVDAT